MSRSLFANLSRRFEPQPAGDRRAFLKAALAASAGLLLSAQCAEAAQGQRRAAKRVVVIGGGLAGLSCAYELHQAGCDVTVLEARPRAGGRVRSLRDFSPGAVVEAGGEFIGSNHPTWLAYARRFGLHLFEEGGGEEASQPVLLHGKRLSDQESEALFKELKTVNAAMTRDARAVPAEQPWTAANALTWDRLSTASWLRQVPVSAACKAVFAAQMAGNNAVPLARQSYLGNLAQVKGGGLEKYWTDSETFRCQGGNDRLAVALAHSLGARLRLHTPVSAIHVAEGRATVRTAGGEIIECDDVVLAVPPSTWHRLAIEPRLPRVLAPQMGTAVKYLAALDRPVWIKDHLSPDAATDGAISMTWDATGGQHPTLPVLLAFSGGGAARAAQRRYAASGDREFGRDLELLYPGYGSHFRRSRFVDWNREPWTEATYSFPRPGQITAIGNIFRQGLGSLHFAGEHTSYAFVGYMEGALSSGVAAAPAHCRGRGACLSMRMGLLPHAFV